MQSSSISPSSSTEFVPSTDLTHSPPPTIRICNRTPKPFIQLNDFICYTSLTSHWCNIVSSHQIPPQFKAFVATLMNETEPTAYSEAAINPLWIKAIEKELTALNNNHTSNIVPLPSRKKP